MVWGSFESSAEPVRVSKSKTFEGSSKSSVGTAKVREAVEL